jgi:hypothetical protein
MKKSRVLLVLAVIFANAVAITLGSEPRQVTITDGKLSRIDANQIVRLVKPYCKAEDSIGIHVKSRTEVEVWTMHQTGPRDGNGEILRINKVRGKWKLDLSNRSFWTT